MKTLCDFVKEFVKPSATLFVKDNGRVKKLTPQDKDALSTYNFGRAQYVQFIADGDVIIMFKD